ncbi:MAG: DUF2948 family protein [Alphaproteobacteria bacterium]|nr:DUF2948 family protein [Alphaproteobacteria bacterium]
MKTPDQRLRLLAEDTEDLTVLSTILQDAVVAVGDLAYERRARRFVAVFSRYRWERGERQRVRAGLTLRGVLAAQLRGIDRRRPADALELLAIRSTDAAGGDAAILLEFAGGSSIRLTVECIDAELRDLGEPWGAAHHPRHALD